MKISITASPVFWLELTLDQVVTIMEVANIHYDSTCKRSAEQGGFLWGWRNIMSPPTSEEPRCGGTFRDLDLILKILEMRGYLPLGSQGELIGIERNIRAALAMANEVVPHLGWEVNCES